MLYWSYKFGNSVAKFDNTPFRIISTRYLDCQHGNQYYKDHKPKSKRVCLQSTRKLGCPAHMMIKEFEIYSQYKTNIEGMSTRRARSLKENALKDLRTALQRHENITSEKRFYVSLPTNEAHENHLTGPIAGVVQKVHPLIADKIEELVKDGYSDVGEVQRFLEQFVQSMFKDNNYYPEKTNRTYYPTSMDI